MTMSFAFDPVFFWLPLIGLAIGILVTMFGGGGGFFYVPILILLFRIPAQEAAALSLAATIPTGIAGSLEHYKNKNIDLRAGIIFGISGLAGALGGAFLSNLFSSFLLQKLFGIYAILLTIPMITTSRNKLKRTELGTKEPQPFTTTKFILSIFFGMISGIMAGLFGTSGTASIVAGLYILDLPVTTVVGTSVLVVLFNAVFGFAGHLVSGQFNIIMLLLLLSGSLAGGFLGPKILTKINIQALEKVYRIIFILLIAGFGIIMLIK